LGCMYLIISSYFYFAANTVSYQILPASRFHPKRHLTDRYPPLRVVRNEIKYGLDIRQRIEILAVITRCRQSP